MRTGARRYCGFVGIATAFVVAVSMVSPAAAMSARAAEGDAPSAAAAASEAPWIDASQYTGLSSDTAAASCWEIKQLHPDSASGVYWLLTPLMKAPAQFWCDQDTDGGGWVKVGQGRQTWETNAIGRGSASALLTSTVTPSAPAVQLPAGTVDALLNATTVNNLADGIRVRRAASIDGSSWQEVRFKPTKAVGWYWSMGAGWPLSSWRVGSSTGTGGTTTSFGSGNSTSSVNTSIGTTQSYTWSFSYGSSVTGSSDSGSYLWSTTTGLGGARPYSEVYVRPMVSSADLAYARIPDSGTAKAELESVPASGALTNSWGVTGIAGAVNREGDVEVQDMAAIGNTMYVAGNFKYVQQNASGAGQVAQPFLAAFNATTGQFISSFRPTINEAVLAVAAGPGGKLAIGGKFTSVNGTPSTGFAILDPSTGALSGPQASITNSSSPGVVRVETISVSGGDYFLGGSFTHATGPSGSARYMRNAARLNGTTLVPVVGWQPEFNGTVTDTDISADGTKAYFAGFFDTVGAQSALRVAAISTSSSVAVDNWTPTWSSTNDYQRAIVRSGDRIYVGGSEHSTFAFDATTYQRLTTHITNPKGDTQVLLAAGGFLYSGSHSNNYIYDGATTWPNIGTAWTRADTIGWMHAFRLDAGTSDVQSFSPTVSSRLGSGGWAAAQAPDGSIWTGGDFQNARTQSGGSAWTGAFVRFPMTDGTAPNTPTNLRSTATTSSTVTLAWAAPSGGVGSGGSYQILRDNRVIASTTSTSITVPLAGERRYFVRAADATGNVSASTSVLKVAGGNPAPTADIKQTTSGLTVTFDASGSTDDGSIAAYYWDFGDGTTSTNAVASHDYIGGGTYTVRLTVVDNQGAWTAAQYVLNLVQPKPADAYGAAVFDDQPWAFWRLGESTGTMALDTATGQHRATYQRGVTQNVPGVVDADSGARFDGVDDVVVSNDLIPGPTTFSTEAWFKTTTTRGGKIIGFGNAASGLSGSYDRHVYMQDNGQIVFGVYVGAEYKITTPASLNDGVWHQVVATLSSAGMALYVDGKLVGTNAQTGAESNTGYWRVGGDRTWGSSSSYFQGDIDEAAVYTTALSASQVQEHYDTALQLTPPVVTDRYAQNVLGDTPSAYWRLDSSRHGIVQDASPNGFGGVVAGGPTVSTDTGVTGGFGSMTFDGVDDGVVASDKLAGPTSYATEIWFNTTTTRGGKLVGFGNAKTGLSSNYDRHIYMLDSGQVVAGVWTGQGTTVTTPGSYNDGQWHYAVGQLAGNTFSLYIDGSFVGSATLPNAIQAYDGYWRLGGDTSWGGTSAYFAGKLDEFALYSAPLTATQIAAHYAAGTAGPNAAPVASFTETHSDLDVSVDGTASHDPDGSIASVSWDFGDGSPVVTGTALTATHTYADAGDYTISLTVTDDANAATTVTRSVTVTAPPNQVPAASFEATVNGSKVTVDGSASSDPDGTIAGYSWDFGDTTAAQTGASATHTYAEAGDYTVTLTVTDDDGATATATKQVTIEAQASGEVVAESASWRYYYGLTALPSGWVSSAFDDAAWTTGAAPIGYGTSSLGTTLDVAASTNDRPRAVYFRTDFTVADVSKVTSLELTGAGDDGVVIYVNGVEVKRQNMPTGTITNQTFASSAIRTTVANANPVVVQVPTSVLVNGKNVIAAETHVNYRGTPDVSFKLKAVAQVLS